VELQKIAQNLREVQQLFEVLRDHPGTEQ